MVTFVSVVVAALGLVVMSLWNGILPAVAGVHAITFVQAMGLLVLSRILFGGLRGRGHRGWRARMHGRWQQMTLEEREHLRSQRRCGSTWRNRNSSTATPQAP